MSFPNIITDKPTGSEYVSKIDDFERETRSWLKQCMQSVSGYPTVETIKIAGWTSSTRPKSNPNGGYLLGYNTSTKSLDLVAPSGGAIEVLSPEIKKSIALLAYPVGSYYYTSNTSFNPQTAWGGKWEKLQDGRVLIANSSSHAVGSVGGSETVTLTEAQMPKHIHSHSHKHSHNRGTMEISGRLLVRNNIYYKSNWNQDHQPTGAFYEVGKSYRSEGNADDNLLDKLYEFKASRAWTGVTSYDATVGGSYVGGGQAHSNMQPYRTAVCWHRTA